MATLSRTPKLSAPAFHTSSLRAFAPSQACLCASIRSPNWDRPRVCIVPQLSYSDSHTECVFASQSDLWLGSGRARKCCVVWQGVPVLTHTTRSMRNHRHATLRRDISVWLGDKGKLATATMLEGGSHRWKSYLRRDSARTQSSQFELGCARSSWENEPPPISTRRSQRTFTCQASRKPKSK